MTVLRNGQSFLFTVIFRNKVKIIRRRKRKMSKLYGNTNDKREGVGISHGKIILMGEHSVVYGYPAIAIPLKDILITCRIEPTTRQYSYRPGDTLSTAIYTALKYLNKQNARIKYNITSDIPTKRGMGSSAAVSIAAIRGVFDYFKREIDEKTLEKLVNEGEIVAHKTPSGLDARTCLSDKAIKFIKGKGFENIEMDLGVYLLIADTGVYGNTGEAVGKIRDMGEKARPMLAELGRLTEETEGYIRDKDIKNIGENMIKAERELKKLGVTIEKSEILVKTALNEGALGAKISGGGLGGCIIALIENNEKLVNIKRKLIEKGAVNIWTTIL